MPRRFLLLSVAFFAVPLIAAGCFVAYVLWPTWPSAPIPLNAPALPITVAGVLFEIPPTAIRAALLRRSGPHERIDLAFLWPSLKPPPDGAAETTPPDVVADGSSVAPSPKAEGADAHGRLFVSIASLGALPPPAERLRDIYPRYVQSQAVAGPRGLAVLPFRSGTPYEGEDLVYFAENLDRFYARCTRQSGIMPGTCMQERVLGAADITLRFPRDWLSDWENLAAGFDYLIRQLHPPGT